MSLRDSNKLGFVTQTPAYAITRRMQRSKRRARKQYNRDYDKKAREMTSIMDIAIAAHAIDTKNSGKSGKFMGVSFSNIR
jgi:hypothetical protein